MQTQSNNNREGVRRVTQHGKGIVYKPVRKRTSNISGSMSTILWSNEETNNYTPAYTYSYIMCISGGLRFKWEVG